MSSIVKKNTNSDLLDKELLRNFSLKSEYTEKNVLLPEPTSEQLNQPVITKVRVLKNDSSELTISPHDLREIIQSSNDIEQVIIEKIKIDEATRISLLFEPEKRKIEAPRSEEAPILKFSLPRKKEYSVDELEEIVNHDDFSFEADEQHEVESQKSENFLDKYSADDDAQPSLKLKEKAIEDQSLEEKKVSYSKHTLKKKNGRHNGYYYQVKDHMELFKVGSSYMKDLKSGLKSFSFSSCQDDEQKQQAVFGICSYFNYHTDLNVLIVTSSFESSFYESFVQKYTEVEREVLDDDFSYHVYQSKGFEVLEFVELKKIERKIRNYDFEHFLEELLNSYDVILWDLPPIDVLDSSKQVYFPIVRCFDNVSIIVKKDQTKFSELDKIISYFNRYQVSLKGMLFHDDSKEKEKS